ncbi:hypothetical protein LMH87_006522 [Akanthomyces muscarius]|uniref:Uncharacterized protein n=1 Tax=Akanthomyces muscarius TaxID=2231603 RepID=A0A9W8QRB5_AKAMU|nr:hypothetical protein LMH87_006522 [Akanthomyces muscarius]KAJ4164867.1 hypothetical protein LMH87_006522 [Akanthomyces muscarius]
MLLGLEPLKWADEAGAKGAWLSCDSATYATTPTVTQVAGLAQANVLRLHANKGTVGCLSLRKNQALSVHWGTIFVSVDACNVDKRLPRRRHQSYQCPL